MPTWLHFPSQNSPKSFQKPIPGGINLLIDFWMDCLSILAPTWDPTWGHVGHFFAQNGAAELSSSFFFVGSMLFFDFVAVLAQSWRHLGSIWEGLGLDFGGFWFPFFYIVCNMFEPFLHTPSVVFRPSWKTHSSSWKTHGKPTAPLGKLIFDVCWAWFWMGWWGHAER